jgi:hypothetical protein
MLSQGIMGADTVLIGLAASLVALWLRLLFQLRSERERRRYLLVAATALPAGSRVHEQRGDGTHITIAVGGVQQNEIQHE